MSIGPTVNVESWCSLGQKFLSFEKVSTWELRHPSKHCNVDDPGISETHRGLTHFVLDDKKNKEEDSDNINETSDDEESNFDDTAMGSGSGETEIYDSEEMGDTSGSGN